MSLGDGTGRGLAVCDDCQVWRRNAAGGGDAAIGRTGAGSESGGPSFVAPSGCDIVVAMSGETSGQGDFTLS